MKVEVLPMTNSEMDKYLKDKKINKIIPPHSCQNGIPTLVNSNGMNTVAESFDDLPRNLVISIMKSNYDNLVSKSNRLFKNLYIDCEWDSSLSLINILVRFKSNGETILKEDSYYPYPLDITIPYDAPAIIVNNSRRSITEPDSSTTRSDETSVFNIQNWVKPGRSNALSQILSDELRDLDLALEGRL